MTISTLAGDFPFPTLSRFPGTFVAPLLTISTLEFPHFRQFYFIIVQIPFVGHAGTILQGKTHTHGWYMQAISSMIINLSLKVIGGHIRQISSGFFQWRRIFCNSKYIWIRGCLLKTVLILKFLPKLDEFTVRVASVASCCTTDENSKSSMANNRTILNGKFYYILLSFLFLYLRQFKRLSTTQRVNHWWYEII